MISWLAEHIGGPAVVIFVGVLISAAGALWASIQQTQYERDLRSKSDEIAELSQKIAASVTGGDSFCYLDVSIRDGEPNSPLLVLLHQGDYPLYDVAIRIVDLKKFGLIDKTTLRLEDFLQADTRINVGNVSPKQAQVLGRLELPKDANEQGYNAFISARNGFVTQAIRFLRVEGRWRSATKVTRDSDKGPVVLYEKVADDFPRDETGQPRW